MAAIIRQWETVVRLLGRIDAPNASLGSTDTQELCALVEAIKGQPAAPKAVWKKLVQQKVPLRLLQACAQQLQSLNSPYHAAAMAATSASMFFEAARAAGAVPMLLQGLQARSGSALRDALLPQLKQSGLLEQLPAVLSATTQHLLAAAEAGQPDAGSGLALQSLLMALLSLTGNMLHLPPEQSMGMPFVPLPAVAGLILSSLRYLSCIAAAEAAGQQQQPDAWQQPTQRLLGRVNNAINMLVANMSVRLEAFVVSSSSQVTATAAAAVEQMLCSEECLLCLAVSIVACALPLTAPQLMGDGSSGSSSGNSSGGNSGRGGNSGSSGGSSSGSVGNSSGVNASRQAGQQLQDQGGRCLPPQLMAVLQQAGCSTLIVARMVMQQVEHSNTLLDCETKLRTCAMFAEAHNLTPGIFQGRQPQQLGRLALLYKLLCAAMLQPAPGLASFDLPRLQCCSKCCVAALTTLQQAQQLQELQAQGSSDNPSNSSNCHPTDEQQQGFVYSYCLQSVQDLLQQLLQLWGSATAVLTAVDVQSSLRLPEDSSSSSSGSNSDQAAVQALLQGADGPVVLRCISCSINVLTAVLLPLLFKCHGASGGGQVELTNVWLCSLLSWQARMSIEAVQASGSSSTVALRQSGHLLASTRQAAAADFLHALHGIATGNGLLQLIGIARRVSYDHNDPGRRHLFDFLCSLLKLCCLDSNLLQQQPAFSVAGTLCLIRCVALVACAAWEANDSRDCCATAQAAAPPPAACAAETASGAAAAAPAAEQDSAAAAAQGSSTRCPDPTAMLPWLALVGRCCLLWARWLQQLSMEVAAARQQLADQQASQVPRSTWGVTPQAAAAVAADPWSMLPGQCYTTPQPVSSLHRLPAESGGTVGLIPLVLNTVLSAYAWLGAGSTMQQLVNLGYNLQPLQAALSQMQAGASAIVAAQQHPTTQQQPRTEADQAAAEAILIAERTAVIGLCPQLQAVGEALTAFAFPLSCNNPGCVNASGPSEARLVGGKACVCGGCLTARYCSRACLKQHWKVHKPVCKALAAAGDGRAAAAGDTHASG